MGEGTKMRFMISIKENNLVCYEDLLRGNCENVGGGVQFDIRP